MVQRWNTLVLEMIVYNTASVFTTPVYRLLHVTAFLLASIVPVSQDSQVSSLGEKACENSGLSSHLNMI